MQINTNKLHCLETFKVNWKGEKVISQYLICDTKATASTILKEALKEYEKHPIKRVIQNDSCEVYEITLFEGEEIEKSVHYLGYFEREITTIENLNNANQH